MSQNRTLTPGFLLISEQDGFTSQLADQFISEMKHIAPMAKGRNAQLFGITRNSTLRLVEVWDTCASWAAYVKDALVPALQQSGTYPSRVMMMDAFNIYIDPRVSSEQVSNASAYIIDVPFTIKDDYLNDVSIIDSFPPEMIVHAIGFALESQLRVIEIWTDDARAQQYYAQELPEYFKYADMTKQTMTSSNGIVAGTRALLHNCLRRLRAERDDASIYHHLCQ